MFSYFVSPETMDAVSDPDTLVRHDPSLAVKFDAIKELRAMDDGTLHKGSGFRRVASLLGPLPLLLQCLDPEFMKEKKNFYGWLDRGKNKAYCTYDRRSAADRQAQFERDFGHMFVKGVENGGVHEQANGTETEGPGAASPAATEVGSLSGPHGSVRQDRTQDSPETIGEANRPGKVLGG